MILAWNNLFGHVGSLLAADDGGGIINILILVVMLILGLVGHIIKKAQEKRQVEQADDKVEEAKRRRARQIAAGAGQADSASRQQQPSRPPPLQPHRQPAAGIEQQPARRLGADLAQGVREEVSKVRRHLSAEQADRKRRLAHVEGMKTGIRPESARAEVPTGRQPKIRLNLSSPKAARTAIICAEILGPPKALRSEPEPWEL